MTSIKLLTIAIFGFSIFINITETREIFQNYYPAYYHSTSYGQRPSGIPFRDEGGQLVAFRPQGPLSTSGLLPIDAVGRLGPFFTVGTLLAIGTLSLVGSLALVRNEPPVPSMQIVSLDDPVMTVVATEAPPAQTSATTMATRPPTMEI